MIALLLTISVGLVTANQPGAELVLTHKGANYGVNVALEFVKQMLNGMQLPAFSGTSGNLGYGISWGRINSFVRPVASVTFDPSYGIRWRGDYAALHVSAGAWYNYKLWIVNVGDSMGVDAYVSGISFQLDTHFRHSGDKIYPTAGSCWVDVATLKLDIHGGKWYLKWIYAIFKGLIENKVKDMVKAKVCDAIRDQVNGNLANLLKELNLHVDLQNEIFVDLGFTGVPLFTKDYIISYQKANIYWKRPEDTVPIEYRPIQGSRSTDRMAKLMFSEYVADALAYQADKHNLMKWKLPLKPDWLKFLANIELGVKCAPEDISVYIETKSAPEANVTKEGLQVRGDVRLTALCKETEVMVIFDIAATVHGKIELENKHIKPNIKVKEFTFNMPKPIPGMDVEQLRGFVTMAIYTLVETINNRDSIDLTNILDNLVPNVRFENGVLSTDEATAMMEMDIRYVPK